MPGFVDAHLPASREMELRQQSPALILDGLTGNLLCLQLVDDPMNVIAYEIKLVDIIGVRRVNSHFRRW